jgi:colanic acid biosynthesis glycosyl transferase WcaI
VKRKNNPKHILMFNRSFWPDVEATGQFLTELCEQLAKRYKITVIAGRPYYGEKDTFGRGRFLKRDIYKGIEILRVRHTKFWKKNLMGRILNWVTYTVLAFAASFKVKPDIIFVCTDPPFLGIIAMIIGRLRSIPFLYNTRDMFPDVAIELGKLNRNNLIGLAFNYFNKKALASALSVVCLGHSMKERLMKDKGIPEDHIHIIPDWVDTTLIKTIPKNENPLVEKFGLKDKFVIMYSGNIGLSQDFNVVLNSFKEIDASNNCCLVFAGEGAGKKNLKDQAALADLKNILFLPYQPLEMLSFSLGMADLHLIPLKKGMSGTIVPSKVYGIMAAGRPYLAVTDKESEPARMAEEFNCGLWVLPDDRDAVLDKIAWALQNPEELKRMGLIGRRLAENRFDKNLIITEWFDFLENLNDVWYA